MDRRRDDGTLGRPGRARWPLLAVLGTAAAAAGILTRAPAPRASEVPTPAEPPPDRPVDAFEVEVRTLAPDVTLGGALHALGLDAADHAAVLEALRPHFDFRRARPHHVIRVERRGGRIERLEYEASPDERYVAVREDTGFQGAREAVELEKRVVDVDAVLRSSLSEAVDAAGEGPALTAMFADAFAWDIDFYSEPREGDRFRMVVEKLFHRGRFLRYGEILAAEYDGALGHKQTFRWERDGRVGYYNADGTSTRRSFLKSPLKFAHITSRFGLRRHPILKYVKAHQGVDYGAPTGTPVWAVGDGTVVHAGWAGASGKMVGLRHANGLSTYYCHLSRISVRPGQRVRQKSVIGHVGTTGRSTGPHLHYAVKRHGRFINPLSLRIPPGDPVPPAEISSFRLAIAPWQERLQALRVATAGVPPADADIRTASARSAHGG